MNMRTHDSLLSNCRYVDVLDGAIKNGPIAIAGDRIASVAGVASSAKTVIDLQGKVVAPGFIDGHIHIESAMLHPAEFARAVVAHGTTGTISDPHEIANVLGVRGIEFMLRATENVPIDCYFMASSCVPATHMESAGAVVTPDDVAGLLNDDRILGLAEVMNFPGVVAGDPDLLAKIAAARKANKVVDGHAPGLSGDALRKYVAAGIDSDHECSTLNEAREKSERGVWIMIREGSAARNLEALLPLVTDETFRRCMFVSDDKHPSDLVDEGHLDSTLRKAVALGLEAVRAVQLVTINPATRFRLDRVGAILPGWIANLVVLEDLQSFRVDKVFHHGQLVVDHGETLREVERHEDSEVMSTVHLPPLNLDCLRLRPGGQTANVIGLTPAQLLTTRLSMQPRIIDGQIVSDTETDILKLAVLERHRATGNVGVGLAHGFGLKLGALASSVAHDSHNIIVVGTNDTDMLAAVDALAESQGGCVVAAGGAVLELLPMPIAGLMSNGSLREVRRQLGLLHHAARELGALPASPFITLSFLALPVIPELKLTDMGLVWFNAASNQFEFMKT